MRQERFPKLLVLGTPRINRFENLMESPNAIFVFQRKVIPLWLVAKWIRVVLQSSEAEEYPPPSLQR